MNRLSVVMAAIVVSACGAGDGAADATAPPTTTTSLAFASTATTGSTGTVSDGLSADESATVDAAVVDLASRLEVDREAVEIVEFQRVTWSDGSLGCPQPGMMYTQALVEGSLTTLSVDGTTYSYHAGRDGQPVLCEAPLGAKPTAPTE